MSLLLKDRHVLTLFDFSPKEIDYLLSFSHQLKKANYEKTEKPQLQGKHIALLFEKPSTRTRCAFEIAAFDQGANVTYMGPESSHLGKKESVKDTARVLGRLYDGIGYRGFKQSIVSELAEFAGIPVWNGLTEEYHPTQALADLMTIQEHSQKKLKDNIVCYLGNAYNNTTHSLMIGAVKMGMDIRIAAPTAYSPMPEITQKCEEIAKKTGATLTITNNISAAVKKADFLYTDVWVSMGEPESSWAERIQALRPYQINSSLIALTENPGVKFMHCLPAFHNRETQFGQEIENKFNLKGAEVTEEIFESHRSIVFDQAENRMHTIKAIMIATL